MIVKAVAFVCVVTGIIGVACGISGTNAQNVVSTSIDNSKVSFSIGAAAIVGIVGVVLNFAAAIVSVFIK
jgi:hypothetical protein